MDQRLIVVVSFYPFIFLSTSRVLADLPYSTVQSRVHGWLHDAAFARSMYGDAIQKTEFLDWAEESLALAKAAVYQDGDHLLKAHPRPEKYVKTDLERLAAPVLSDEYPQRADAVVQRRMVLAGYRLGDLLASTLKTLP